jgi:pyruvate/2-oxoglutarate dehydrogenase complex dihydrolipoamide acyltransferase (E2) component
MIINHEVISPCYGIVEKVLREDSSFAYEGELIFIINTNELLVEVLMEFSGIVMGIEVQVGDEVISGMILAFIQEDTSVSLN